MMNEEVLQRMGNSKGANIPHPWEAIGVPRPRHETRCLRKLGNHW